MKYTYVMLSQLVADSKSVREVMRKLGMPMNGNQHRIVSKAISDFDIPRGHFQRRGPTPWQKMLKHGKCWGHASLKRAMIEAGIEYKCRKCGNDGEWHGEPITLQIEHIDGERSNNLRSNLEFLCPNCHSQTPTYSRAKGRKARVCGCGKKLAKNNVSGYCIKCFDHKGHMAKRIYDTNRPSKEELEQLVWEVPSSTLARRFNVSDKAIEKWCKKYEITKPGVGYWRKKETNTL